MVDPTQVIITNLGPKLPQWATDATLREIEVEVKKLVEILQKQTKSTSVSTKKTQDALDEFEKSLQDSTEEQQSARKGVKELWKNFGDSAENTTDALEKIRAAGHSGFAGITNLTNAGQGLFTIFKNIASPANILGGGFVLAGAAVGSFVDYIKDTTQAMIGLYDTGLTFQNGLGELRMAASTAAMPLDEFGKLLSQSGAVVKGFGVQGAQGFSNVLKQTRELVRQQGYYGLNINQVNGYTADYLEILRSQGLLTIMDNQQRAQGSAEYIKQLTSFSQIMGKSREEINKQIQQTLNNPQLLAITGSLGPLGKQFTETMTSVIGGLSGAGGPQSEKIIGDVVTMIGTLNGPMTDLYQGLLAAGRADLGGEILSLSNDIKNNAVPLDVAQERLKKFLVGVQGLSQQDIQNLRNSTQVQGSALHDQAELIVSMNSNLQGLDLNKVTEKMVEEPDRFTESVIKLSNLFGELRGRIGVVFAKFLEGNQGSLDRIMANISDFAEYLASKLEIVLDTIGNLVDPATRQKTVDSLMNGISSILSTLLERISDFIEIKLGISSQEFVERRRELREKYAGVPGGDLLVKQALNLTDPDQIESYKGTAVGAKRFSNFAQASLAAGVNPSDALGPIMQNNPQFAADMNRAYLEQLNKMNISSPGPGPKNLANSIMNNSPIMNQIADKNDIDDINEKQKTMFYGPVIELLQQNNDLLQKNNDLTDDSNDHLSGIKRTAASNPNIIRHS